MPASIDDINDPRQPLPERIKLALEFAITAMNAAPSFRTSIENPAKPGRTLSSYEVLSCLDRLMRELKPHR